MSKQFLIDALERILTTFAEAFLAVWLVVGAGDADQVFTWPHIKIGLVAGALAAGKSLLATLRGNRNSASLSKVA